MGVFMHLVCIMCVNDKVTGSCKCKGCACMYDIYFYEKRNVQPNK